MTMKMEEKKSICLLLHREALTIHFWIKWLYVWVNRLWTDHSTKNIKTSQKCKQNTPGHHLHSASSLNQLLSMCNRNIYRFPISFDANQIQFLSFHIRRNPDTLNKWKWICCACARWHLDWIHFIDIAFDPYSK